MGALFDQVRAAAAAEQWLIGDHADEMLRLRRIVGWQIVAGLANG